MQPTSANPPGGNLYKLSTECMPPPEGGVQALAVLSDDVFVTGHDDNLVTLWGRIPGTREFSSMQTLVDHQHMLRAILGIPTGVTTVLPTGGFATACLDKKVRLYSYDPAKRAAALVRTMEGHLAGVISLTLTVRNELVSGGWEGHARVWDIETGTCLAVLEGHENATRVAGLSDGSLAIVSTGRKNEFNQHVDYKVRIWKYSPSPSTGKTGYALLKVLTDPHGHDQAVQDVDAVPELGFITASNDGTVKVRALDGDVLETFTMPINEGEGKPWSAFRARVMPSSHIVACAEDQALRVYSTDGLVDEIQLPGTPWCVAGLANGDIVVVGNQAGTSRRGHVFIFTTDVTRHCSDMDAARFKKDMEPPPKAAPGGGGSGGGGGDQIDISGPYEQRSAIRGQKDGQNAFFLMPNGQVMLCAWSAAAGGWMDIGVVTDGPGDGDVEMEGGGSNAAAGGAGAGAYSISAGPGAGASGKSYDYTAAVTMDTATGMRSMQLRFNEEDDPITVAKAFVQHNGINEDCYEEVKNHIIEMKMSQGEQVRARKKAAALASGASYVHFPAKVYLDFSAGDMAKLLAKLWENNAALAAAGHAAAVSGTDEQAVKDVAAVLADTRRYHATKVPRPGVTVILSKLLGWPAERALPAVDLVRMVLLHPDGAEAVGAVGKDTFLSGLVSMIKAARQPGKEVELRPVALVATRALFNAFKNSGSRSVVGSAAAQEALLECLADIIGHDHASVRTAGTVLLLNYALMVNQACKEAARTPTVGVASGGGNPTAGLAVIDQDRVQQALALAVEALTGPTKDDLPALLNTLVAIGTLCTGDKAFVGYAKGMELPTTVASVAAALPNAETIFEEPKKGQVKAAKEAAHELADVFKRG